MPANRFDTSANQEYVSQYVPMPFDAMYKVGMGIKEEHAKQQAEADALADQLNKIKVVNEVLSEGSGDDLGIKSRKIGYGDFKNEVLNKYTQESKRLADEYHTTGDGVKFKQGIDKQKADFNQDFQKLKIAEANSAAIEEMNKKIRENKDAGIVGNEYILNPLAAEGRRLLNSPYSTQYQGASIGEALKIEDEINKSAQHYADQMGSEGIRLDQLGNVIYEKTHGVTADRIRSEVYNTYDKGVGLHTQQQVMRSLLNEGVDPNTEKIVKVPIKFDKKGKPTEFEDVKTTEFNYRYSQTKQKYADAVVAKAERSVLDTQIRKNWQLERQLKKQDEEEAAVNIVTTNEQGNSEVLNLNSVLKDLDLDNVITNSGDWLTKQTADFKSTNVGVSGGFNMFNVPILGSIIKAAFPETPLEQVISEGTPKLVAKSKQLGLPVPKDNDYKKQIFDYAIELAKRRSTTSNLQQSTIQGMNKAMLGPNSNIHNMEFYVQGDEGSNAKITNEEVKNMPKNASYTSIDFFGPKQAGWKLAVSTKDKDGATTDKAYLAVPRDKTFEEDTRAVHNISRGALDFAKTGKVNSEYFDEQSGNMLQGMMDANKNTFTGMGYSNVPKLVSASVERNRFDEVVVMGSYVDNSTGTPQFKAITYYPNRRTDNFKATSLDEVQANKTTEIQAKGSLKQYNTSFKETTTPSEISIDDNSNENN